MTTPNLIAATKDADGYMSDPRSSCCGSRVVHFVDGKFAIYAGGDFEEYHGLRCYRCDTKLAPTAPTTTLELAVRAPSPSVDTMEDIKPPMNYAERCNYWKTSKSSPDAWLEKTIGLIEQFGGDVLASGYGNEHMHGRAAYMIRFRLADQTFRIVWPVLPSESGDTYSARRQAATMLCHDVKAKCVASQALGARVAFFAWLELPDGRSAFEAAPTELLEEMPRMLLSHQPQRG